MIWVTWRQHRTQAVVCLALFCAVAIAAVALGAWMRSTFSTDGLGACLARSGGAGCTSVIEAFTQKFNGPVIPLGVMLVALPGFLGAAVGAPLLGTELERGTWQLAWSQTVPRTRWLVTQLALVVGGLVVFGAAVTAVVTWARAPLDEVSMRAQAPLNFEGLYLTCSLLCAFALGVLAGLLLRNTIGGMVVAYIAWEAPSLVATLLSGPLHILTVTKTIACTTGCARASASSIPPVTGNLGDQVLSLTRTGNHLIVTYEPASRFWTLQLIDAGLFLAVAAAALGTAIRLLHRRTT
ncbi:MAG TPA: hypothetical protein VNV62_21400 [Trebonia sp.]|nr:hypothetical protein [Trebonia sp.]